MEKMTKDKVVAEAVKYLCENILKEKNEENNIERIRSIASLCDDYLAVYSESQKKTSGDKRKILTEDNAKWQEQ